MGKIINSFKQLFIYFFVGAGATVVEWLAFYLLNKIAGLHYSISTAAAFIASTFANWAFGRLTLFNKQAKGGIAKELAQVYAASVIGLVLNLIIMFVMVERFSADEMIAKIAATCIVFFYNFLIRKLVIYKV